VNPERAAGRQLEAAEVKVEAERARRGDPQPPQLGAIGQRFPAAAVVGTEGDRQSRRESGPVDDTRALEGEVLGELRRRVHGMRMWTGGRSRQTERLEAASAAGAPR
jgi:hypothetical protein